jgi:hypothetical protein
MIEEKIKELKGQTVLLAFSRGKDAIVTWLYLREHDINVIPVYYSLCPEIEFVNESLSYYEKYFQQKIEVLPSERYADMIQCGVFLTKSRSELADTLEFTGYDKKQLNQYMRKKFSQKDKVGYLLQKEF